MKVFTLSLLFFISVLNHSAFSLTILSDVDDTIKISNVLNPANAATRALSNVAFTGMRETYSGVENARFIYLSARPQVLAFATEAFLKANAFPKGPMIHRQNFESKDPLQYKSERIRQILIENPNESFLLVGDDTQADPEAYAAVSAEFSRQIAGIYIHQISGRALPRAAVPYLTAYDLASAWAHQAFLSFTSLEIVTQSILSEKQFNRVLPKFQTCPVTYEPEDQRIGRLILAGCSNRLL